MLLQTTDLYLSYISYQPYYNVSDYMRFNQLFCEVEAVMMALQWGNMAANMDQRLRWCFNIY